MNVLLQGIPAAPGLAIGPIWRYRPAQAVWEETGDCDPLLEWARCESAMAAARQQLVAVRERTRQTIGQDEAQIFDAHIMMLDDPELLRAIRDALAQDRLPAEAAVQRSVQRFAGELLALDSDYLQARAQDVLDVGRRLVRCLQGLLPDAEALLAGPAIILAEELTPSDTVGFGRELVLGFCTLRGSPTSHAAILARSLDVPAVVHAALDLNAYQDGKLAILDGSGGTLHVDPDPASLARARQGRARQAARQASQSAGSQHPAITRDGHRVEVAANIGGADDARQAIALGAEGVGLLRSEFLYLGRTTLPGLEEQVQAYQEIAAIMGRRPIVVRTLDIGGDKAAPYLGLEREPNPFLGWRAIRMMWERPDVLRTQFEALLQGFAGSDLRIMLPFVSALEEVVQARQLLKEAAEGLSMAGRPAAGSVQFGVMVEVPSVALLAEHFAPLVDFFSIGTNDLAQYVLAVDRTNERVAGLASPFHPAVIRLIARTVEEAHRQGKWVGLCGEMAGDPLATPLLLGLGLDEFSMAPASIPAVKARIRQLSFQECQQTAQLALAASTAAAVKDLLSEPE